MKSLSLLESGEYFFKFLFLFSIGLFCLSLLSADSPTFDHRMAWHRCYHPIKQPNCVPCSTPLERLYCCRHVSLIEGDIFQSPFSVAHCVSADQALKKGLAREIKRWYPLSWVVRAQDWSMGKVVTEIIHVSVPW